MLRLSFSTLGCPAWTLRQIVENATRMGYSAVDLRGLLEHVDVNKRSEFTTDLSETRQLFDDNGIAISGVAIGARYAVVDAAEKEEQFDETRRNLELACKLDTHILRVYGGRIPKGHTIDSIMPIVAENLREMADEAEQYDVTLAVETHDDWTNSNVFARLMAEVNHPRVRALWDLHHPFRANGEPAEVTYKNLAPYVVSVHVKDSIPTPEGPEPQQYGLIGAGDVPLKQMLDMLVAGGYDGYAILESEKRWTPNLLEPEVLFPQYVAKMKEWLG